jgi:hypothetical protein
MPIHLLKMDKTDMICHAWLHHLTQQVVGMLMLVVVVFRPLE